MDHVVPKCFFLKPLPHDMLTVRACHACNSAKSKHDDFLRDLLVTDVAGAESPIAQRIFQERTLPSHIKGKSLLARISLDEAIDKPLTDASGTVLCVLPQFTVDAGRMDETFRFLIRGLRYSIDAFRFVEQTRFITARLLFDEEVQGTQEVLKGYWKGPISVGNGVFDCIYGIAEDEPNGSVWLLRFYERMVYRVVTRGIQA